MFSHFYLWGEAEDQDILEFYPTDNRFTQVMQVASIINIIITNAGYLIIASRQFVQLFASEINFISIFVGAIMVIFVCGALDYYYESRYENIIELIGSITYSFMALLLPPILYIRAFKVKGLKGWSALIHLIICLAITGLIIKTYF
ncbi:hypothetical protein TVAG_457310 [Trichomonas vaginalis G3]|uniref:Amino acid transporter transmembrane domain-containing protein n=1 Tax=Trichomonas vaginalis (strain ATCC PRA-98 / G3) TaxID=412133 RepID=A2DC55_TRIV3|nr:hypothetical protein TVAGG3_0263120 [Trichomonas vaginalis G3]EAY22096.1 hypothetical protein TVAG_457310 [Trichomonas vaginalis G3]KAI5525261.1 hypothetical protein TVAGG3_0263120 [Trichomonas vaginalis G3]|eukprot:XP_001583082.1 hypothetical protein [Trichomonas vaginalis G3]